MNVLNVTRVFLHLHNLDCVHLLMESVRETERNCFADMITNIGFWKYSCFSPGVYNFFQIHVSYPKTVGARKAAWRKLQSEAPDLSGWTVSTYYSSRAADSENMSIFFWGLIIQCEINLLLYPEIHVENKYLFLYAFFCVILRRLNFICRRFGTHTVPSS
jgi:hypothetical protein